MVYAVIKCEGRDDGGGHSNAGHDDARRSQARVHWAEDGAQLSALPASCAGYRHSSPHLNADCSVRASVAGLKGVMKPDELWTVADRARRELVTCPSTRPAKIEAIVLIEEAFIESLLGTRS
jgi:hypothetical protein